MKIGKAFIRPQIKRFEATTAPIQFDIFILAPLV